MRFVARLHPHSMPVPAFCGAPQRAPRIGRLSGRLCGMVRRDGLWTLAKLFCGRGDGVPVMNARSIKNISLLWLVCCGAIANAPSANSAEPIKIGAVLPFSGGVELYGRQAKLGLDLAAKDVNAAGGGTGRA